jgi:hypothetical protein
VLRPDHVLVDGEGSVRAIVCTWPPGTASDSKPANDRWSATPTERAALLCRSTGVPLALLTDGLLWRVIWAPIDAAPANATFTASLFGEERALLDAFVALLSARRFFAVPESDTIEALFIESATAQEVVAEQLGKQVRAAAEHLVAAISRDNRDRDGELLAGLDGTEIYEGTITILMRLVFLLFAEERGLLPLDDEQYARFYAVCTLREQLQHERDLHGDEPLERRSTAWFRLLALFRAVHGGTTHDALRIPPYGGRLFDPDRFPFLEGRAAGGTWRNDPADPIPVDDLTMLEVLNSLQVLQFTDSGIREARQLSYRTLEVEQIGHVYEGLLDHSIRHVDEITLGLVGRPGDEPEVPLSELETAAAGGRDELVKWLQATTGRTDKQLAKLLDTPPGENDRQLLAAAVDNDEGLTERLLRYVHLLRRDLRDLPIVMLDGAIYVTQTSTRREGGVEYTTKDLADEVAQYALEPLVYSPGPQDGAAPEDWVLRPSAELLDLKICDPAVGSGAILVAAGRYLADRVVEAWVAEEAEEAVGADDDIRLTARRAVADRCLYGVDRDPLATEMAKLSLWLITMAKDRPFTFLDHSIRTGDALLGITDLDQVRWMHLDPSAGRKLHRNLFDWTASLEPLIRDAVERRRRLAEIRVITVRDAEDKPRLTAEADADLRSLRVIADLVCGATLSTATGKKADLDHQLRSAAQGVAEALADGLDDDQRRLLLDELAERAASSLNEGKPDTAPARRCLHWPLEFPEVFLGLDAPGFSAFVGNPPYIGNKYWKARLGPGFQGLFQLLMGGTIGKPDLIVPFIWRMVSLTRSAGTVGTLSTQSVSEVDSKKLLERTVLEGSVIYRAFRSKAWPGQAAVFVSQLWLRVGGWEGRFFLDDDEVQGIGSDLRPDIGWPQPRQLSNALDAFEGVHNARGLALVIPHDHPLVELRADEVKPYISGEDITQGNPTKPARYVLDLTGFGESDLPNLPDPVREFLVGTVQSTRTPEQLKSYKGLEKRWWTFWNTREEGFNRARAYETCVAVGAVAKYLIPLKMPSAWVFTNKAVLFVETRVDLHCVLLSQAFDQWARIHGGSLGEGRTMKIASVVRTFPLPLGTASAQLASEWQTSLYATMAAAGCGATEVLNAVHDSTVSDRSIIELRDLCAGVNRSVLDAYGWNDLASDMEIRETAEGRRLSLGVDVEQELLERLHRLNAERVQEEAGLRPGEKVKKRTATRPADTLDLFSDSNVTEGDCE